MILLNSEKQCIYMYRGRRRRAAVAAAAAEEEKERRRRDGMSQYKYFKSGII
jgi:hypothetical protein